MLIKTVDSAVASELASAGFLFMKENIGEKDAYVFVLTDELVVFLNKNFCKENFIYENKLRF